MLRPLTRLLRGGGRSGVGGGSRSHSGVGKTYDFVTPDPQAGPRVLHGPCKSAYGPQGELVTCGMLLRMKRRVAPEKAVTIPAGASAFFAIETMATKNVGAVVVVDPGRESDVSGPRTGETLQPPGQDSRVVGIFSERDYLKGVALKGKRSKDVRVEELMTTDVVTLPAEAKLDDAVRLLSSCDFRHLPITKYVSKGDARQIKFISELCGVLSVKDILWMIYSLAYSGGGGRHDATPRPESSWMKLTVEEVMRFAGREHVVHSVAPNASVFDAITTLDKLNVGALVVRDVTHCIIGIVSERDYLTEVVLKGRTSHDTRTAAIMSRNPVCVTPHHTVDQLLKIFCSTNIRHLPVVASSPEGSAKIGVVQVCSMRDVLLAVVKHIDASP